MKIKLWVMISYLVVMIVPLTLLYFLYISVSHYDRDQSLQEFLEVSSMTDEMDALLSEPKWYDIQPTEAYEPISRELDDSMSVSMYRADGVRLYSSSSSLSSNTFTKVDVESLFQNVNTLTKKYRTYSLKRPVFEEEQLIGFYEISIARDHWLTEVNNRIWLFATAFCGIFLLIFGSVMWLFNRKLNHPLRLLQHNMTAFAKGKSMEPVAAANDEIGELTTHFEEMKLEIEEARNALIQQQRDKEFIVASLSHDVKTPLTVIQAYTEALLSEKDELSGQEKQEYSSIVFEKLRHMRVLLDDLSTYTALQSSKAAPDLLEVDGEELFDMLLSGFDEGAATKKQSLITDHRAGLPVLVHVPHMTRIVDNLMTNALRHAPAGGAVWLAAVSSNEPLPEWIFPAFQRELTEWWTRGTLIVVQNEGPAIPGDQLEHVFEPFVQADQARGNGGSSGLGLSITRMLIHQHNGAIRLWSEAPYGTLVACMIQETGKEQIE